MSFQVTVYLGKGGQKEQAESFARKNNTVVSDKPGDELTLVFDKSGVSLSGFGLSYQCDFTNMLHRVTEGRLAHEMLVRAAKSDEKNLKALDATAGMGEDSFLLAAYGYNVTLCEQNPVIAALLKDGIRRAKKNPTLKEIASRMSLVQCDSIEYMPNIAGNVDVIYLDPMFPARQKSSLVNKKLQLIQKLEAPCSEETDLFNAACAANPSKIIVKRPLKAPKLAGRDPSYTLSGKAIRYDCYVRHDM
jgi:16S rRNA (guanine1516-N2)-methyltransferase